MTDVSRLTDRIALQRHRDRAQSAGMADVLHRCVADEFEERLNEVNKSFSDTITVSGFPELWASLRPGGRHIQDAETLDVEPGSADLILHALALHWADDPVGQMIQARRALRPDGLFLACLFGGQTLAALRQSLAQAEAELCGGLSPRVAPMADLRDMGGLLQRAGLALPVADTVSLSLSYRDALHLMHDLRAMGETNALAQRHSRPPPRAFFARAAQIYAAAHSLPDGRIKAQFDVLFLAGWAPSKSQPQPLRPGTAKSRLADALGTQEQPLPGSNHGAVD